MKQKNINYAHLFDKEAFEKLLAEMYEEIEECVDEGYKIGYRQAILNIGASFRQFCKKEEKEV